MTMRPEPTTDELVADLNHAEVFDRLSDRERTHIRNAFLDEEGQNVYDDILGPEPLSDAELLQRVRQWRSIAAEARNERIERIVCARAGMGRSFAA
jgi:hypothetical protein